MPVVRIGFNPDFGPFTMLTNGRAVGLVIERVQQALDKAGIESGFAPVPLPDMANQLLAGEFEALVGVAAAPERSGVLAYSRPLATTGAAWFPLASCDWPKDEDLRLSGPHRWRVVSPAAGPAVARIRARYPNLELSDCNDYGDALDVVLDGRADAAALNLQVGRARAERDHPGRFALPAAPFFVVPLVLAVLKADPCGLLNRLDPHIPTGWGN